MWDFWVMVKLWREGNEVNILLYHFTYLETLSLRHISHELQCRGLPSNPSSPEMKMHPRYRWILVLLRRLTSTLIPLSDYGAIFKPHQGAIKSWLYLAQRRIISLAIISFLPLCPSTRQQWPSSWPHGIRLWLLKIAPSVKITRKQVIHQERTDVTLTHVVHKEVLMLTHYEGGEDYGSCNSWGHLCLGTNAS